MLGVFVQSTDRETHYSVNFLPKMNYYEEFVYNSHLLLRSPFKP